MTPTLTRTQRRVVAVLLTADGPVTRDAFTGIPDRSVRHAMADLEADGWVERAMVPMEGGRRGQYRPTWEVPVQHWAALQAALDG